MVNLVNSLWVLNSQTTVGTGEFTTELLLNRHVVKLPSKLGILYPWASVAVSINQESFSLSRVYAETHNFSKRQE